MKEGREGKKEVLPPTPIRGFLLHCLPSNQPCFNLCILAFLFFRKRPGKGSWGQKLCCFFLEHPQVFLFQARLHGLGTLSEEKRGPLAKAFTHPRSPVEQVKQIPWGQATREGFQEYQAVRTLFTPYFLLSFSFWKHTYTHTHTNTKKKKNHSVPTPRPPGRCPISSEIIQPPGEPSTTSRLTQCHLLSIYYMPGIGLNSGSKTESKKTRSPCLPKAYR